METIFGIFFKKNLFLIKSRTQIFKKKLRSQFFHYFYFYLTFLFTKHNKRLLMASMNTVGFLAAAAAVTTGLTFLNHKRKQNFQAREVEFDEKAKTTIVRAPFIAAGPETEVDHVGVPHLRELFSDLETFDR